ncbi:hypothetical protein CMI42_01080 [Candidatus Pacearchaeota archaeon]|nr:hypothetical protein [Candidatus Pacearchaeota archaeon]|tara:strand:- start:197 stop:496 length:300 start_codon:yes stop_codon:yes gene_type:complete
MTEVTISTRIPMALEKELEKYMKAEYLEKSAAVRRLLFKALEEWRIEYALRLLKNGKTTISRGAEIAGINIWEFVEKVRESKIKWVSDEVIDHDLAAFK